MAPDAAYVASRRALLDALDVFRLLRAVDPPAFAAGFACLRASRSAADSTLWALIELQALFCGSGSVGVGMVVRATEGLIPEAEVRAAVPLLAREVLGAAGGDAALAPLPQTGGWRGQATPGDPASPGASVRRLARLRRQHAASS